MNTYGPCECAAVSSLQSITSSDLDHANIGHGLETVLWIVDVENDERLVPVGGIGEVVIKSASIGRGYLNHEEDATGMFFQSATWLSQL